MSRLMLKFASNISTLFQEEEVLDRLIESRRLGFSCFEAQNLYNVDIGDLLSAKAISGLDMILTNTPPEVVYAEGDGAAYFGYACVPGKQAEFITSLQQAIEFARALDCKKIHILAGLTEGNDVNLLKKTYIKNLKIAAAMLQKENRLGLIEPLCPKVMPNYFLDDFNFAVECLVEVGSSNLKLMLDIYHLEMLHGDAVSWIDRFYPYAGHIQVSQAPNREEPSARGLIDYRKVFQALIEKGHSDFIGLEYFPRRSTRESLTFLRPSGFFTLDFNQFDGSLV